jgi:hypothetical protein
VSAPTPSAGDADPVEPGEAGRAAAAEALRAAFARLRPQGSDPWNFLGAFNQLADQYGPDHPGASALAEVLNAPDQSMSRLDRLRQRAGRPTPEAPGAKSELEEAMARVVEAFRWLSARVSTLEERLAREDLPLDGPAWFAPAVELGQWSAPVAQHIAGATPGGEVLHGDCGEGALLGALEGAGVTAVGVEPRGGVALRALEGGHAVTICEVTEALAERSPASLGGLVLSGVVDRLPLHALVALLAQARRVLAPGAPIVVVSVDPSALKTEGNTVTDDLVGAPSLYPQTWLLLLDRAGFVHRAPLDGPVSQTGRFAIAASVPA